MQTHLPAILKVKTQKTIMRIEKAYNNAVNLTAVYLNDVEAVKKHLNDPDTVMKELDPECPKNTRCKPVSMGALNGSIPNMKLVLGAGADINGKTGGALSISLVAEINGQIVGHIAFSPITASDGTKDWYGLGPVSVLPDHQKQGAGKALINNGLSLLKDSECFLQ